MASTVPVTPAPTVARRTPSLEKASWREAPAITLALPVTGPQPSRARPDSRLTSAIYRNGSNTMARNARITARIVANFSRITGIYFAKRSLYMSEHKRCISI